MLGAGLAGYGLGALALAAALGGLWGHGYSKGNKQGSARVTQAWQASVEQAREEATAIRAEGQQRAAALEVTLGQLEKQHAATAVTLRSALRRPVSCPASGRLGDLLLPADLVDGMFGYDAPGSGAAGPASGKPSR